MPGFIFYNRKITASTTIKDNSLHEQMSFSEMFAERHTLNKYLADKLFFQNDRYMVILDGVILNKNVLCKKFKQDWANTFILLYEKYGVNTPSELRGSFCGMI